MSEKLPTQQFVEMLKAQEGKRAVYRGTGVLAPVIIEEVRCGSSFEAKLEAVDGIVLCYSKEMVQYPKVLNIGAAWGMFDADSTHWVFAFPGCCWRVQLDEATCEAVVRLCHDRSASNPEVLFGLADRLLTTTARV